MVGLRMNSTDRKPKTSSRVTEKKLVDVLVAHMRRDHDVRREVAHYEKKIDVVALAQNGERLSAIEAKTSDWQKACQQAMLNLTAAEFCYIAIWSKCVHRVDLHRLREFGIGLIAVGTSWGDVEVLEDAQPSEYLNRLARERIRERYF
jgi:hypothetical protein